MARWCGGNHHALTTSVPRRCCGPFSTSPRKTAWVFFSNAALAAVIIILLPHESDAAVLRISFHDIYEKLGNTVI